MDVHECQDYSGKYVLQYNTFSTRGAIPGSNTLEFADRLIELKSELRDLEQKELMLDQQKRWLEQGINNTTEDCSSYPFLLLMKLFFTILFNLQKIAKSA